MKKIWLIGLLAVFIISCNQKDEHKRVKSKDSDNIEFIDSFKSDEILSSTISDEELVDMILDDLDEYPSNWARGGVTVFHDDKNVDIYIHDKNYRISKPVTINFTQKQKDRMQRILDDDDRENETNAKKKLIDSFK